METVFESALRNIALLTGGVASRSEAAGPLGQRVAAALGWERGSARLETVATQYNGLKISRGFLGPQRAAVFAANGKRAAERFLSDAALFAYHSSIHWGLVADEDGVVVFNSHWIHDDEWFRLPEIRWSELDRHVEVLRALTPQGVANGRLDQIATGIVEPDNFLTPVDDALVERLDHWRREALRRGKAADNLDQELHMLFAQFFVLRAVEDRHLARNISSLRSTVTGTVVDPHRLHSLFNEAREAIQSQLFAETSFERFPSDVLAGIIRACL